MIRRPDAMGALNIEGMKQFRNALLEFRDDEG
jgi:hypothetical protein